MGNPLGIQGNHCCRDAMLGSMHHNWYQVPPADGATPLSMLASHESVQQWKQDPGNCTVSFATFARQILLVVS